MDAKDIVLDFDVKEVPSNGINPRANPNNRQDSTPQHFVDSNQGILSPIKQYQNIALYLIFYPSKGNIFHENQFYISQVGQSLIPYFGHLVSNDLGDQWTLIQIFDSWMSLPLGFASTITLRTKDHIPCCQCFAFGSMLLTKGVTRGK